MDIQTIPLSQLKPSPKNVRKSQTSVAQLAASIHADGLLHNLVVERVNGHHEVIAGGRRLRAMQQLVKEDKLPAEYGVLCKVIEHAHQAIGISTAENVIREPMRPTEQFNAFRALLDQGVPEADVAARLGVTTVFLRQRMKLAKLCESVREALDTGELTLEQAEAFTLSDDQELQEEVFQDIEPAYDDADDIRARFRRNQVRPTDPRTKFIGVAAYEKAGGQVVRDLFAEKDAGYLADENLLDQLVMAKLEKSASSVRAEGWGWVEVGSGIETYRFQRLFGEDIDKATAGAIVTLSDAGKVEIHRGYLKPGQKQVRDEATGKVTATAAPAAAAKDASKLSAASIERLQGERTVVLRHEVGRNPQVALAALAASLASRELLHAHGAEGADQMVRISRGSSMGVQFASPAGAPTIEEDEAAEALWTHRLPGTEDGVMAWLLEQPEQVTIDLLAFLSGRAIAEQAVHGAEHGARFAQLASVDMALHWKVSAEWLQQQPTGYLVAAVTEACGKESGAEVTRAKGKAGAVAKAMELLQAVPGWLPEPLRAPAPKAAKKAGKKK